MRLEGEASLFGGGLCLDGKGIRVECAMPDGRGGDEWVVRGGRGKDRGGFECASHVVKGMQRESVISGKERVARASAVV